MLSLDTLHKDFRSKPKPKVFVPFLAYDWRGDVQTFFSFLDTLVTAHVELVPPIANFQDGVARSRNAVTYHFRHKTDAEYLFFAALDTKFAALDLERIVAKMDRYDLDLCAGMYAGKGPKLKWIFTVFDTKDQPDPQTGLLKAKQVGTDFLCIRRRVFDKIEKDKPELRYNFNGAPGQNDPHVNFFGMPIHQGELESEDWNFSRLARESGFTCYVDTQTVALHRGNIYFPLFLSLTPDEICEIVQHRFKFDLKKALDPTRAQVPALPKLGPAEARGVVP